jgi:3-deoxy-D-manno-octulosonate 8-phosphate phosphatase (KDO 8-P phosphatase)
MLANNVVAKYTKEELINKFKDLQLLCLDVDGTLTNGSMYLDEKNIAIKRFFAHDGTGIAMVKNLGVKVVLVSTSISSILRERAKVLNLDDCVTGSHDKGKAILELCKKHNISTEKTIHMGDDVNDILGFNVVGFPIAPANAVDVLDDFICYKTQKAGGYGAVREICDLILLAKTGRLYGPPYVTEFLQ